MTKHKFTPGPWEARQEVMHSDGSAVSGRMPEVRKVDKRIARVHRSLDANIKGIRCEEAEANARLIAAAPDLYEALTECFEWLNGMDGTKILLAIGNPDAHRIINKARAALAKVDGGNDA